MLPEYLMKKIGFNDLHWTLKVPLVIVILYVLYILIAALGALLYFG